MKESGKRKKRRLAVSTGSAARSYAVDGGTVLVLNKDGSPLNIVPWQDAITRLYLEKVTRIKDTTIPVRSTHLVWMRPSVVMVRRYVKPDNAKVSYSRRAVFERDGYICQYCGEVPHLNGKRLTVDHVTPRAKGGKSEFQNVVTCCSDCNHRKKSHTLAECGMRLLFGPPRSINAGDLARRMMSSKLKRIIDFRPDWKEFLGATASRVL